MGDSWKGRNSVKKNRLLEGLVTVSILLNFAIPISAQAQLFQNNNESCEDHDGILFFLPPPADPFSISSDASITCGAFNDDTPLGNPDFPDCATVVDDIPNTDMTLPNSPLTNSIFINTGAHGQNCINAGEPNAQFFSPTFLQDSDLFTTVDNQISRMGTIVHGNLDGSGFEDLGMVFAFDGDFPTASKSIAELFNTGNGFGPPLSTDSALLEPMAPVPFLPFPANFLSGPVGTGTSNADRSLVLLNCDADAADEGVVIANNNAGGNQNPVLVVMQNSGAGLEDGSSTITIPIQASSFFMEGSLAKGDFDGDGVLDLAVAVASELPPPDVSSVILCHGDGNCSFTCPNDPSDGNVVIVGDPTESPNPTSIVAGDVDGDGDEDIVITENDDVDDGINEFDIRYFFNNGGALKTWPTQGISFVQPGDTTSLSPVLTLGRFSSTAVQMGIDEVAVNNAHGSTSSVFTAVEVITTDGAGGLNPPTALAYFPPLPAMGLRFPLGIEAKDLDHCGGDDIVALSTVATVSGMTFTLDEANTSVFLNTNEAPVVTIGPNAPTQLVINTPLNIPTTCMDPTNDDRTFQWKVVNQPAGATVVFGTPNGSLVGTQDDASTSFEANQVGNYTIQIDCTDFCGLSDQDLAQIQIPIQVVFPLTQGDNLFHCNLHQGRGHGGAAGVVVLLLSYGLFLVWRLRLRRDNP
jgi:VCBS repeat protein